MPGSPRDSSVPHADPSLRRQGQKLTYRPVRLVNSDISIGCATGIRVGNGDPAEANATNHVWLLIGRQVRLPQRIELRRVACSAYHLSALSSA